MLPGMFVYYFAMVDEGFATVEARVRERLDELEAWAGEAYRSGEEIAARMRIGTAGLAKEVRLHVDPVSRGDGMATMRLSWEATGVSRLFPRLDADLIVAGIDDRLTQITLRGSYEPPLGVVGRALDRALLHRVAEASVKEFVDRVAVGATTEANARS